jgi:hypothetical protein
LAHEDQWSGRGLTAVHRSARQPANARITNASAATTVAAATVQASIRDTLPILSDPAPLGHGARTDLRRDGDRSAEGCAGRAEFVERPARVGREVGSDQPVAPL